jgi:hypothetical protein
MSFNPTSALVDGTFRNPAVLIAVLAASLAAVTVGWVVVRSLGRGPAWRWGQYTILVVASPLFLLLSPLLVARLIDVVSGTGPGTNVSLCLMPTHYFARDCGPGIAGLIGGALTAWRGEHATRAA